MIVESIRLTNFLSHADSLVDFSAAPLWLVWGQNGAGKSALFDALEYALYGKHRGGDQNPDLLVKHGARAAEVEVVIRLDGERLCIKHHIPGPEASGSKGRGGQIARWNASSGTWATQNVGDGTRSVWNWLDGRLPRHDLFRSAIFLRQGETAHFFGKNAQDRIKRFGDLIDLSRYTALSQKAKERQKAAEKRRTKAEGGLQALGDVSDEAVERVQQQIGEARQALEQVAEEVKRAKTVLESAKTWADLEQRRAQAQARRNQLQGLLDDEEAIKAADDKVKGWNRVATDLHAFWQARKEAESWRQTARDAEKKVANSEKSCDDYQQKLRETEQRRRRIIDEELPGARTERESTDALVAALELEVKIAKARAEMEAADRAFSSLAGADTALNTLTERWLALPRVENVARAREAEARAAKTLREAEAHMAREQNELAAMKAALPELEVAARETAEEFAQATGEVERLRSEQAHLEGRLASHGTLTGGEAVCPVCDQSLDDRAHDHVRTVVAEERSKLERLNRDLESILKKLPALKRRAEDASARWQEASTALQLKQQAIQSASEAVTQAQKRVQAIASAVVEARMAVNYPDYVPVLDVVTVEWVREEQERVKREREAAEKHAEMLREAEKKQSRTQAALETLRGQRRTDSLPLGDTQEVDAIEEQVRTARHEWEGWKKQVEALEQEDKTLEKLMRTLTGEVARLEAEANAAREQARSADEKASTRECEADSVAAKLGEDWAFLLGDREHYKAEQRAVEALRADADRLPELLGASGQLKQVDEEIRQIDEDCKSVDPAHRIPLTEAQAAETAARERERTAAAIVTTRENELANLNERRSAAEEQHKRIQAADEEARTWNDLADLLKEGGPLQVEVVARAQAHIAAEVNAVLNLLGDPLQVKLGEPRRRSGNIQDIHIVDTSDPTHAPRFFEFLSGGEKFRIALALALALHRRVGRDRAGTIIVDEGFGNLDSHRRDMLARQMADTGQGILRLGLAENIILCSHSDEVKHHFRDRWVITKQGGTAHAICENGDSAE